MSLLCENMSNRILEALNYPVFNRCAELPALFEQCSLRELQEIFPALIHSIFGVGTGGLGWGLRATTKENSPQCFDILHEFFSPLGPLFRLCYRLLSDSIKFEFSLDLLPYKVVEMIQSGHYAMFYADLVNIDPFRRSVCSLSLNAFDYYMVHFVIHATLPLHKIYPAALQVHNERMKTVYFFLTAGYLATFLPISLDGVVLPNNLCPTIKSPQAVPAPTLQPKRTLKYLRIPNLVLFSGSGPSSPQSELNADSPRTCAWRTESVLHFFIDVWLRYNVDEARDLPSSEFIRVIRILIKQTHAFANTALVDQSAMATLRKLAHPLMRAHIHSFIRSIVGRWPLDSSMSVVLELWLSYIQPWRYTFDVLSNKGANVESAGFDMRFDRFIMDNLVTYTQMFAFILPRFARLDFTSFRNVVMLHRLAKVFSQPDLSEKLCRAEQSYLSNSGFDLPKRHHLSGQRPNGSFQSPNISMAGELESSFSTETYKPLFGTEMLCELKGFIGVVMLSRLQVLQEIAGIQNDIAEQRKSYGFFRRLVANIFEEVSPAQTKLRDIGKIPEILELAARALAAAFNLDIPDVSMDLMPPQAQSSQLQFSLFDTSELDMSTVTPMKMMKNLPNLNKSIDPALLPIEGHECKLLVRMLHQVSCKINELLGEEMRNYWDRNDIWGKMTRRVLRPPMTAQWFHKPQGVSQLCEDNLPPRLCLRPLGSYRVLVLVALSLCIGQFAWSAPSFGLILLIFLSVIYLLMLSVV